MEREVYQFGATARQTGNPLTFVAKSFDLRRFRLISGANLIIYSKDAAADRAFLRDILRFSYVDAGHDWLIFALPPAEVAVHPADVNDRHELYLMCDDVDAEVSALAKKGVGCLGVRQERWGLTACIWLPGGGTIGLYQPKHPTALK